MLLRISLCLMLGFGINIAVALEISISDSAAAYSQGELQLAAKLDTRRRGNCGISPDVWTINLCDPPQTFCYFAPEQVKLWLPKEKRSKRMDRLEFKKADDTMTNETVIKRWSNSDTVLEWPAMISIESGTKYLIKLKKWESSKTIQMYKIEYNPNTDDDAQLLKLLKSSKCNSQADRLELKEKS